MKPLSWAFAFFLSSIGASAMLWNVIRDGPARDESPVVARDPKSVSDIDLEIIVGRIREGDLYALKGDLVAAKNIWSMARAMGEGLWPVHHGLALSYARHNMAAEAEIEFAAAEKVGAADPAIVTGLRCQRAMNLRTLKGDEAALGFLLESDLATIPGDFIVALVGKDEARAAMVEKRAEIDPRYWPAACSALVRAGMRSKAARAFAKVAVIHAPWDPNIVAQAIAGLREEKRYDEAVDVCRAHAKAAPGQIDIWEAMGDLLTDAGRPGDALVAYTSIVDIRPGDADAHRRLGAIFVRLKRYDDAIRQFESVRKLRPEEPDASRAIAETWLARGEFDRAEAEFDAILKGKWDPRFGDIKAMVRAPLADLYAKRIAAAKGDKTKQSELRRRAADLGITDFGIHELKIVMSWDTPTDIDLYVTDPKGEVVSYQKKTSSSGAVYFVDDTDGHGPETYALAKAPAGTYKIEANYCGGTGRTTVRFVVVTHEGEDQETRTEHTVVLSARGERRAIPDVVVK